MLDHAGIRHAGAGPNAAEAASTDMLDLDGLKLGLIAATDNMRAFAAGPDRPGLRPVHIHAAPLARAQGATFHAITGHMRALCRAIGTDVVATADGLEIPLG